jgi:hypothetical protein
LKKLLVLTPLAAAAVLAVSAFASPANAAVVPANLGPGWTAVQLYANSGGGCAVPASDTHLAPVQSEPCGGWTWYERQLGTTGNGSLEREFVDASGSEAIGYSGGEVKLETPNAGDTFLIVPAPTSQSCDGSYCEYQVYPGTYYIGPNGAGKNLQLSTFPSNEWLWAL